MTGARFPLGEHVSDEWYPGATLPLPRHPQMEEGLELFKPEDEDRFWLIEGHWSRASPHCAPPRPTTCSGARSTAPTCTSYLRPRDRPRG